MPTDWATTQDDLGTVLSSLGERGAGRTKMGTKRHRMPACPDRVKVTIEPGSLAARPMLGRPTTHKVRIWAPFGPGALLAVLAIAWASIALPIHVRAKQPLGSTAIDAADFGGRAIRSELQQQVFRSAWRSVRASGSPEPFVAPTVTRPCAREQSAVAAAICPAEPSGYLQRRTALPRAPPLLMA